MDRISLDTPRKNLVISFAQFRPEKQHRLQLEIWKDVLDQGVPEDSHFTMIGTVRGPSDQAIVDDLDSYAKSLGIRDRVSFEINQKRDRIYTLFSQAKVAMHTMKFEHFGIAIVELMASGIITVAHKSAGPLKDIIGRSPEAVGYLAETKQDYSFAVKLALVNYEYP